MSPLIFTSRNFTVTRKYILFGVTETPISKYFFKQIMR
jgi:hypothetical protein